MDNLRTDTTKTALGVTAFGLAFLIWVALRIVIPALVNMHDDFALIVALIVFVGVVAATYIAGRALYRLFMHIKGDKN